MQIFPDPYRQLVNTQDVMAIMERDNRWPVHEDFPAGDRDELQMIRRALVAAYVRGENRSRMPETDGVRENKWNDREILPEAKDDLLKLFLPPELRNIEISIGSEGSPGRQRICLADLPLGEEECARLGIDLGELREPLARAQEQFRQEDQAIHDSIQTALTERSADVIRNNRTKIVITGVAATAIALGSLLGLRGCGKDNALDKPDQAPPAHIAK